MIEIIIGTLAVIVAVLTLFISWWYNRKSMYQASFHLIVSRWESEVLIKSRKEINDVKHDLLDKTFHCPINHPRGLGYGPISARNEYMKSVSNFFDSVGSMIYNGYADRKQVYLFLGIAIDTYWRILGPYIKLERRELTLDGKKQHYYQKSFEWLVVDFRKRYPKYFKKFNQDLMNMKR